MKIRLLIATIFLFSFSLFAQQAIGEWKTYPAFGEITDLAVAGNKIYAISLGNMFSYNVEDNSLSVSNKENGMSDISASLIAYDENTNQLIVCYANSNIDIIKEDKLYNIPDLMNKSLTSSKAINAIFFYEKRAYVSTDFGILVLNLEKKEVSDTYILGKKVYNTVVRDGRIYTLTEDGIYEAKLEDNLLDIHNWTIFDEKVGTKLLLYNNELYLLVKGDGIYKKEDSWTKISSEKSLDFFVAGEKLVYYTSTTIYERDKNGNKNEYAIDYQINKLKYSPATSCYWISNGTNGLYSLKIKEDGSMELLAQSILPDGPMTNVPFYMDYSHNRLMVAGGGRWGDRFLYKGSIMLYEKGDWYNYPFDSIRDISKKIDYKDIISLAVQPGNRDHVFAASCGDGLYEFQNHKLVKLHTLFNSPLESALPSHSLNYQYVRVDALSFDEDENLWMSNYLVDSSIRVLKKDGTWLSLAYDDLKKKATISQINHFSNGDKWIILPRNIDECGLFVLDINGDLDNVSNHKTVYFHSFTDTEGKVIYPSGVFCAVEDKNGAIWVGTDKGPIIFPNPNKVFDVNYRCTRIKVPLEETDETSGTVLASYLLENERLNCIEVDGGNRKWIGTEASGVYLLSEDGKTTIHHFTKENSPLPSNRIISLSIDPETGEVFIGSEIGIVSYMSNAIEGKEDYNDVYAFPNPVRPDYEGLIAVRGLKEDSDVIITDIQGREIYKTISLGGEVTWNGKDGNNKRVSSGVYLVMCATSSGEKGVVAKLVVLQ